MSKVCTYCDNLAVRNVIEGWLPSLRNQYIGDVAVFCYGLSDEDQQRLRIAGAGLLIDVKPAWPEDGFEHPDWAYSFVRSWADYCAELPAGEGVLIYDGADVGFQGPIGHLVTQMDGASHIFMAHEPRALEDSPSTMHAIETVLGPDEFARVGKTLKKKQLLNSGIVAGSAGVVGACFSACLEHMRACEQGIWCAEQAWLNYWAYILHPGSVKVAANKWCYDLRFYPWTVDAKERYLDKAGNVIPVVHAAGLVDQKLYGVMRPMKKQYGNV